MKVYPPPMRRHRGVSAYEFEGQQISWFFAMTGIPWKGDRLTYGHAVAAWRAQFGASVRVSVARHALDYFAGAQSVARQSVGSFTSTPCIHCGAALLDSEAQTTSAGVHGRYCCRQGKVKVPELSLQDFPRLHRWWISTGDDEDSRIGRTLRTHSRAINNALAFTSLCVQQLEQTGWNPSVVIQGRVAHKISCLATPDGGQPAFAQIMVHDPDLDATAMIDLRVGKVLVNERVSDADKARVRVIVEYMHNALRRHNPYACDFISVMQQHRGELDTVKLALNADARPSDNPNGHARTYNDVEVYGGGYVADSGSACKEVTVLLSEYPNEHARSLYVCLHADSTLRTIPHDHRAFDPLHYVLMFPRGEDGYCRTMTMTMREYYAYRLQVRPNTAYGRAMFMCGRLFQEYCCISFAKVESERLLWYRMNQTLIRAETYKNLVDHVGGDGYGRTSAGRRIVLGPQFMGGPRNQQGRFHDAMAIVRDRGRPSFFITFTCNPKWAEIVACLQPGQTADHRPDVVSRVFHAKYKALLQDLTVNMVLGPVCAHLSVIEFQKRGLPHAHILLILHSYARLFAASDVDDAICAEVPTVVGCETASAEYAARLQLQKLVCMHMLHNDCASSTKRCPCHKSYPSDTSCTKGFPKSYSDTTVWSADTVYPQYRRRPPDADNPICYNGRVIDNRWITPYNPYLLLKYDAHLNVEACVGQHSVKYLYKYVLKNVDRGDRGMVRLDEITSYHDARVIGSSEAVWRLLGFDMHSASPGVERLPVHLHHEQTVLFADGEEAAAASAGPKETKLTEWVIYVVGRLYPLWVGLDRPGFAHSFDAYSPQYRRNPLTTAFRLTYAQWPVIYAWNSVKRTWSMRARSLFNQRDRVVGRLNYVNPAAGEQFYLGVLLMHVTCLDLWHYVDTLVDGSDSIRATNHLSDPHGLLRFGHPTYQSACAAFGYLTGMDEWHRIMRDVCDTRPAHAIRFVFVLLLTHNEVSEPVALFEAYARDMGDFYHTGPDAALYVALHDPRRPLPEADWRRLLVLYTLHKAIREQTDSDEWSTSLPPLSEDELELLGVYADTVTVRSPLEQENSYFKTTARIRSLQEQFDRAYQNIKDCRSQLLVVDAVRDAISTDTGCYIFLDAPGGTGKTYCLNAILAYVRMHQHIAVAVASTGIAALLLSGGCTVHSRLKLPIAIAHDTPSCISVQSATAEMLRHARLLVYDEAPMHSRYVLELVDRTLRDVRGCNKPFGGISIILAGDFRQLLPITPRADRVAIVNSVLKSSKLWSHFTTYRLTENMRVRRALSAADRPGSSSSHASAAPPTLPASLMEFSQWLLDVGEARTNTVPDPSDPANQLTSLARCTCHHVAYDRLTCQQIIDSVYTNMRNTLGTDADTSQDDRISFLKSRAILASRHSVVSAINDVAIDMLPGEPWICTSANRVEEAYPINIDYLASIEEGGLPPSTLYLKPNMPITLLRNLNPSVGLCNGTRLLVQEVYNNSVLIAIIVSGGDTYIGTSVCIPRIKLFGNTNAHPFKWSRLTFPVRPSFAMTVRRAANAFTSISPAYLGV